MTTRDVIDLIHNAGGIAVIAHPAVDKAFASIEPLVKEGLDGLEVRHPGQSRKERTRLSASQKSTDSLRQAALTPRTDGSENSWTFRRVHAYSGCDTRTMPEISMSREPIDTAALEAAVRDMLIALRATTTQRP